MSRHRFRSAWFQVAATAMLMACAPLVAAAGSLRIAVASNFKPAMEVLAGKFESSAGHELLLSYGSTGKHFAQIMQGAPFDVFLAADAKRPARLEADGLAIAGSRFTYAVGVLVLWAPGQPVAQDGRAVLESGEFRFLAIANPQTAPYGYAAEQVLRELGLWDAFRPRIVRGENIGQAHAYVQSGNAELGFVALSQVGGREHESCWLVPGKLYDRIEQQAVLLTDSAPAREFLDFLHGSDAAEIIRGNGYRVP